MFKTVFNSFAAPDDVDQAERPWPLIRTGLVGTLLLVIAVSIWVSIAPISSAVIGTGIVEVAMSRKTVQHQEGGIVSEILVRDGSKVKAGQTLLVLKDVGVDAGNEAVRTQLHAELAKAARLSAQQTGASEIVFPAELLELNSNPRVAEWLARETSVFNVRRKALGNQTSMLNAQALEASDEIEARRAQIDADDRAIALQREEITASQLLGDKGLISNTQLLSLRRDAAQYESRRAEGAAEMSRARQNVSDFRLRAETLRSSFAQEASSEYRQATAAIFELRERLRPALDAQQRLRISAPIDGEVVDLRITSVGGVIAPRESILDIVPENADLLVKARVKPEDITSVHVDSHADVRLTAFRQRITPTVNGTVTYISADRLVDEVTNMPYYLVHVRVSLEALREAGNLQLQPGMPAMVFIRTTSRNALQYLLDPIVGFLQLSLREQ
jgi:epimerase transport system membrane fusion protein